MSRKTTLYLVRHCEAEGNWRRTFQGHTDSEVSDKGRRQLEKLAQRFAPIHLDAVYSSPLKRAVATAQAIDRAAGLPIQLEPDVIEINGGRFEGVPFADLPRLFRFCSALELHGRQGVLVCFDFQAAALKQGCGDRVALQLIDFDKFERGFLPI